MIVNIICFIVGFLLGIFTRGDFTIKREEKVTHVTESYVKTIPATEEEIQKLKEQEVKNPFEIVEDYLGGNNE